MEGYWGLDADGCKECICNEAGTQPDTYCDRTSGQCGCKKNTEGIECNLCKDQFYNLDSLNKEVRVHTMLGSLLLDFAFTIY